MFYKILNASLTHHGFQYKEGLNVDTIPFSPTGECKAGGLYFTTEEFILENINLGNLIADVEIPEDAVVYEEKEKSKANKLILKNIRPIEEFITSLPYEKLLRYVSVHREVLKYVLNQTEELCLRAVQAHGESLEYVREQTTAICLSAVKKNGFALKFVLEQTPEICLEAVRERGQALGYVKNQTMEIKNMALKNYCKSGK